MITKIDEQNYKVSHHWLTWYIHGTRPEAEAAERQLERLVEKQVREQREMEKN